MAWWLAARPKTLTGAIAPVLMGGAMAFAAGTEGAIGPFALCLLFAVCMQIDANFINDFFDFRKGTDRADRLGPERACAQGWITPKAMTIGIAVTTITACVIGLFILSWHLQWELILVGLLCVIFCFLYTTCLSYLGWGDVLVLVFFGLVPVVFTYYVMTGGEWSLPLVVAAIAMGLATDNLLMVNNYRDRHQDRISGKRTIVVRIIEVCEQRRGPEGLQQGESISRRIYLLLGFLATALALLALWLTPSSGTITRLCGASISAPLFQVLRLCFPLVYLCLHIATYRRLLTLDGRALNQVLGATARNIFLFSILFTISLFF